MLFYEVLSERGGKLVIFLAVIEVNLIQSRKLKNKNL